MLTSDFKVCPALRPVWEDLLSSVCFTLLYPSVQPEDLSGLVFFFFVN